MTEIRNNNSGEFHISQYENMLETRNSNSDELTNVSYGAKMIEVRNNNSGEFHISPYENTRQNIYN